jgi:hypothetical protein
MKATTEIKKIEKTVTVDEKTITLEMSEREARRLFCVLGSISPADFKKKCQDGFNDVLMPDDIPFDWTPIDTNIYYNTLSDCLKVD